MLGEPSPIDVYMLYDEAIRRAMWRLRVTQKMMSDEKTRIKVYEYAELILYYALKKVREKIYRFAPPE